MKSILLDKLYKRSRYITMTDDVFYATPAAAPLSEHPSLASRMKLWKSSSHLNMLINRSEKVMRDLRYYGWFEGDCITNIQVRTLDPRAVIDKVILVTHPNFHTMMFGRNHAVVLPKGTWLPITENNTTNVYVQMFPRNAKYIVTYTSCVITNAEQKRMVQSPKVIGLPGAIPLFVSDGLATTRYNVDMDAHVYKHRL